MDASYKNQTLDYGFSVGTKAIDTYDACCDLFEFKRSLRGNFAQQKKLFATNATVEGYSVWMLAHNSLIETFNKSRNWFNIIVDSNTIKEVWFDTEEVNTNDFIPRVCFFKTRSGKYIFYGVYILKTSRMEEVYSKYAFVRTFKKISSTYPIDTKNEPQYTSHISQSKELQSTEKNHIVDIEEVVDGCTINAHIIENGKKTSIIVDLIKRPFQKFILGKKVGEDFSFPNIDLTYHIERITIQSE